MRWKGFNYRPQVGITWRTAEGEHTYHGTKIFLDDRVSHRFFIQNRAGELSLGVDARTICVGRFDNLFSDPHALFFQIGSEAVRNGDRLEGSAARIVLKSDTDAFPQPIRSQCFYEDKGTRWSYAGGGKYMLGGTADANLPHKWVGFYNGRPCVSIDRSS
jgi:hypothetical protein